MALTGNELILAIGITPNATPSGQQEVVTAQEIANLSAGGKFTPTVQEITSNNVTPTDITFDTTNFGMVVNVTTDGSGLAQTVNLPNFVNGRSSQPEFTGYRVTVVMKTRTNASDVVFVTTPTADGASVIYVNQADAAFTTFLQNISPSPANSAQIENEEDSISFVWTDYQWSVEVAGDNFGARIENSALYIDGGGDPNTISHLQTAGALVGTESIPLTQGTDTKKVTPGVLAGFVGAPPIVYSAAGTALPAAATVGAGARAMVSDETTGTFGATYASGGALTRPVYSNGTNWEIG